MLYSAALQKTLGFMMQNVVPAFHMEITMRIMYLCINLQDVGPRKGVHGS